MLTRLKIGNNEYRDEIPVSTVLIVMEKLLICQLIAIFNIQTSVGNKG